MYQYSDLQIFQSYRVSDFITASSATCWPWYLICSSLVTRLNALENRKRIRRLIQEVEALRLSIDSA